MTRTPDAWEVVSAPINYIRPPVSNFKLALLLLSGLIVIGLVLWGIN